MTARRALAALAIAALALTGCGPYYPDCAAARSAGAAPLHRGDPGYRNALDGNGDGTACETS